MAEQTTPLAALHEEFDRARGDDADGVWAFSVSWRLLRRDVEPGQVHEGLVEALELVRETQESPVELFGTPAEHADALHDRWVDEGRLRLGDPSPTTWVGATRLGLVLSVAYGLPLGALVLVRGGTGSATFGTLALVSVIVGLGSAWGTAAWGRRHRARSGGTEVAEDQRWSAELTEILRTRHAWSGPRARALVAEAHAHARESGRPVAEEFGTPAAYATRLAPDDRRRSRLTALTLGGLTVLSAVLALDGPGWSSLLLVLVLAGLTVLELRRHRRPAGPGPGPAQSGR